MTDKTVALMFEEALAEQNRGNFPKAIDMLTDLLILNPEFAPAWNNRASMIAKMGSPFDAIMNYDKCIELDRDVAAPYNNRGASYSDLGLFEAANKDYAKASELAPSYPEPYNNLGNSLMRLGHIPDAVDAYRKAIAVRPDYHDAHLGLSLSLLKDGQFAEGWKEFEHRWDGSLPRRGLPYLDWRGEVAQSKDDALLLYGEQGLGDFINFMRYAKIAKEVWGGKVYLEVRQALGRITRTMKGIDGVVIFGEKPPTDIKFCAPMMSVPNILHYYDILNLCPYLHPDPYRASVWRERLKALPEGFLVGLCWAGMARVNDPGAAAIDKRRSVALADFAPIAALPGISWVSLQLGPPASQLKASPAGMTIGAWDDDLSDFYDTAALMQCLDLVITVDTAVAHIAGAVNVPVWMLSRFDGCWRWGIDREDTPWYPSMRIFNQKKDGDWAEVMQRMTVALRRHMLIAKCEAA